MIAERLVEFLAGAFGLALFVAASCVAEPSRPTVAESLVCCDGSCSRVPDASDLTSCAASADLRVCDIEGETLFDCARVELLCCAESLGVGWLAACEEYVPGSACGGVVLAEGAPSP